MSDNWDDVEESLKERNLKVDSSCNSQNKPEIADDTQVASSSGCSWGFDNRQGTRDPSDDDKQSFLFTKLFQEYLEDRQSLSNKTKNHDKYANNPHKALQEWFEYEGQEFQLKTDKISRDEVCCSFSLTINDETYCFESDSHKTKKEASDEIHLAACKILDKCNLLFPWNTSENQEDESERRKRLKIISKEDDLEYDAREIKRHCNIERPRLDLSSDHNYDSLMDHWKAINNNILQLKIKITKMDQRKITQRQDNKDEQDNDSDGSEDPLDAYMSGLESNKKAELSMDDKIEISKIKCQISDMEREQNQVARLLELMKRYKK